MRTMTDSAAPSSPNPEKKILEVVTAYELWEKPK